MEDFPGTTPPEQDPYVTHADILREQLADPGVNTFEHNVNTPALHAMLPALIADRKLVRRVLDFGCGAGNFTETLAQRYPRATIVGVDQSAAMLPVSPGRDNLYFAQWDGRNKLEQPPFDLIISKMSLHYVDNDSYGSVLCNLAKVLAPKGWLITSLPAPKVAATEVGPQNQYVREIGSTGIEAVMFSHSGFLDGTERILHHLPQGYVPLPRHVYGEDGRLRRYNTLFCPESAWKRIFRRVSPAELDPWVDSMLLPPTRAAINRRHARHNLELVKALLDLE